MTTHNPSRTHMIYTVAIIGFIFTLHLVIPMYSNSSFLSLFANAQTVGYIYMVGSAVSILGFLIAPVMIRRVGNYTAMMWLIVMQIVLFYGLINATDPYFLAFIFALQMATTSLIGLSMDIFLEGYTANNHVGAIRGLYTATLNASWVIGPLIGSMLITGSGDFKNTYIAALAMLFPLLYLVLKNFPRFHDPNYIHLSPWQLVKHVSRNKSWMWLFVANFILQVFYAWMVVYSPIYLNQTIGFSWEKIGIIFTIMLVAFPLIQYPLGKLTDKRHDEKGIMAIGFGIMGLATISLAFITSASILIWSIAFFMTRIGAAAAEVMMETYFFKTVSSRDSAALGLFRVTRPLSYFFAPIITAVALMFTSSGYVFIVVGIISLFAIIPSLLIKDTE
ncbi:MAG: MFS transporter [Candidatus Taylorbacteria bacterium]|nr:MFS transporter [Candidatus Taylorbacteria bacterium]